MVMSFELDDLKIPEETKAWIQAQVASGRYASETELVVEALNGLFAKIREMDELIASLTPELKLMLISDAARALRQDLEDQPPVATRGATVSWSRLWKCLGLAKRLLAMRDKLGYWMVPAVEGYSETYTPAH